MPSRRVCPVGEGVPLTHGGDTDPDKENPDGFAEVVSVVSRGSRAHPGDQSALRLVLSRYPTPGSRVLRPGAHGLAAEVDTCRLVLALLAPAWGGSGHGVVAASPPGQHQHDRKSEQGEVACEQELRRRRAEPVLILAIAGGKPEVRQERGEREKSRGESPAATADQRRQRYQPNQG